MGSLDGANTRSTRASGLGLRVLLSAGGARGEGSRPDAPPRGARCRLRALRVAVLAAQVACSSGFLLPPPSAVALPCARRGPRGCSGRASPRAGRGAALAGRVGGWTGRRREWDGGASRQRPMPLTSMTTDGGAGPDNSGVTGASPAPEERDDDGGSSDIICAPPAAAPWLRHPAAQAVLLLGFYALHVFVLCRQSVEVPLAVLQPLSAQMPAAVQLSWEVVFGTVLAGGFLARAGADGRRAIWQFLTGKGETKLPTKAAEKHKKEMPETLMLLGLGYLASGYMGQVSSHL